MDLSEVSCREKWRENINNNNNNNNTTIHQQMRRMVDNFYSNIIETKLFEKL
jgi:hypothetical protein